MAVAKNISYKSSHKEVAKLAKALAHPARIAIIQILMETDGCICDDITNRLPIAQSTVSQHLKALKEAGIIKGEVDGVRTCYCLNEKGIAALKHDLVPFLNNLTIITEEECC